MPDSWWRWISHEKKKGKIPDEINRRHFEVCVLSQIMLELKAGDLYIEGSEKYADYRQQLISWEDYETNLTDFCQKVNVPMASVDFIAKTKLEFQQVLSQTNQSFPHNQQVRIINDEVVISKLKKQPIPLGLKKLEEYIAGNLEPINVLDMLADTEYWLNWTRFFGPISGHDAKLDNAVE